MKKLLSILLFILIFSTQLFAKEATLEATFELKEIDGFTVPYQNGFPVPSFEKQKRAIINLEGLWKKERFNADHDITMNKRDSEGYEELINEAEGRFLPEYDDSLWEEKYLPSVENIMNEYEKAPEYYEDGVWYRKTFTIYENLKNFRAVLKFHSVNYVTDVWINGQYGGWHEGGYTPFAFDITPFIKPGQENLIAVRIDNPPWGSRQDIVPYNLCDWFNYTGIIQDIYIEIVPSFSISRVDIVPKNLEGDIEVKTILWNPEKKSDELKVFYSVYRGNVNNSNILSPCSADIAGSPVTFEGEQERSVTFSCNSVIPLKSDMKISYPSLWTPQSPSLYLLKVTLMSGEKVIDEFFTQFGIRTIETEGNKFLLNKVPTFFTSVARHEDHPLYGRAIPEDIIYSDLMLVKDIKAAMMRSAHYPNNPFTYILADRMGIAIIEEIPVWWFDDPLAWEIQNNKRHIHEQMWREMIFRDYNRPSIFLWSASNECYDYENRKIFIEKIHRELDSLYPDGRLVTQSSAVDRPGPWDPSQFAVDVPGWTMYYGIFYGEDPCEDTEKFLRDIQEMHPDRPVLNTEYGRWSREDHSEQDVQNYIFENTFKVLSQEGARKEDGALNENGGLMAVTWWCIFDWYTHTIPEGFQSMGLYQMDRKTEKEVLNLLKDKYGKYYDSQPYNSGGEL